MTGCISVNKGMNTTYTGVPFRSAMVRAWLRSPINCLRATSSGAPPINPFKLGNASFSTSNITAITAINSTSVKPARLRR